MEKQSLNVAAITDARLRQWVLISLVVVLLAGLPIAVWLDLRNISESALRRQASDLNSMMTSIRAYYGSNVVGRIMSTPGSTQVVHNYEAIPGAIPIPATLSIELGSVISEQQANIAYRFVSDYPFKNRAQHVLDGFENSSLAALRAQPNQQLTEVSWSALTDRVRLIAPVILGTACVNCHNSHPDSPKRDWKVGDVRGIQEVSISQPIVTNLFSFKYLLIYFVFTGAVGFAFISMQHRQAAALQGMNQELEGTNEFLASTSTKLSRYLSPQIYKIGRASCRERV